ncbi:MAG: hypothetical protein JWO89_442 [Verrucomicrobiaceae bacterium]|nr:hypothetical protein [Verrucomicrobiaceae bacterium]
MPALRTKCVHSPVEADQDGLRILVTRYVPRSCPRTRYHVWMASLGPSEKLLKAFLSGSITWKEFAAGYQTELFEPSDLDKRNPRIKNRGQKFTLRLLKKLARRQPITLMCNCADDDPECHRYLLKALLDSNKL